VLDAGCSRDGEDHGERFSNHARASCDGVAPSSLLSSSSGPQGALNSLLANGNHGMKAGSRWRPSAPSGWSSHSRDSSRSSRPWTAPVGTPDHLGAEHEHRRRGEIASARKGLSDHHSGPAGIPVVGPTPSNGVQRVGFGLPSLQMGSANGGGDLVVALRHRVQDLAISSTRRRCIGVCRVLCGDVTDVDASTRFLVGVGQYGMARSVVAVRLAPMRFAVRSPLGSL
jgi:hypothetical protein